MYTLLRHTDGRVTLRTHVDPESLPPEEARRLLRGLRPLLAALATAARGETRDRGRPRPLARPATAGLAAGDDGALREREPVLVG